jgi:hypothetical protein
MPENFYDAIRLDRSAPPQILGIQLDDLIAQTKPGGHNQQFLLQAKAILSDPGKKAIYDARLADPSAPPWSPQELHELAMAQLATAGQGGPPPPPGPPSGPWPPQQHPASAGDQFKQILAALPKWVVPVVAGAVALLMVVIVAASCSGGGDGGDSSTAQDRTATSSKKKATTAPTREPTLSDIKWYSSAPAPKAALRLTKQADLPFDSSTVNFDILQFQDKNIGVKGTPNSGNDTTCELVIFDQSMAQVSRQKYRPAAVGSECLGLPSPMSGGKGGPQSNMTAIQVAPGDGIEIGAGAAPASGTLDANRVDVSAVYKDQFADNAYWVILKNTPKLFRAELEWAN